MFSWIKYINRLNNKKLITEEERTALEIYCNSDKYEEDSNLAEDGEGNGVRIAIDNELKDIRDGF